MIGLFAGIRLRLLVTDSMHPSVHKGSLILLKVDTPCEEIEEGNVIALSSCHGGNAQGKTNSR